MTQRTGYGMNDRGLIPTRTDSHGHIVRTSSGAHAVRGKTAGVRSSESGDEKSWGQEFEFRPGDRLSWPTVFLIFLSSSAEMSGYCLIIFLSYTV